MKTKTTIQDDEYRSVRMSIVESITIGLCKQYNYKLEDFPALLLCHFNTSKGCCSNSYLERESLKTALTEVVENINIHKPIDWEYEVYDICLWGAKKWLVDFADRTFRSEREKERQ